MRVLGVDFGSKRIGLAVGESDHKIATPRPAIAAVTGLRPNAEAIKSIAEREQAEVVVLGVPYNAEQPGIGMEKVCLKLAETLREIDVRVATIDESLTSEEAISRIRTSAAIGRNEKGRKDSEAACLILERFFEEYRGV